MKEKDIILTDRQGYLTKKDTKMLQGLAVLAMVILHLFDRLDYAGLYQPMIFIKGYPLIFYFAQLSDFCVMGYAFCSGYALAVQYNKCKDVKTYMQNRIRSIKWLLINYWIILVGFSIVSILAGNAQSIPGNWLEFLGNFTTVISTYNGAWWYLFIYIVLVLLSPFIFKMCDKVRMSIVLICSFLIYTSAFYVRFYMNPDGWIVIKYGLFGMTLFEFLMGVFCYKDRWVEKVRLILKKMSPIMCKIMGILIITVLLIVHTLVVQNVFIAPFTGLVIILVFALWKKPKVVQNIFCILGNNSTNIWLIHMFFYSTLFKNLVYAAKYPLLILAYMLGITLIISVSINQLLHRIKKVSA